MFNVTATDHREFTPNREAATAGLTWDARTDRWVTHAENGADAFTPTFPETWGWADVKTEFEKGG